MSTYTDADIEMVEMAAAGNMIAIGVCPLCEDALDPIAFKARFPREYSNPRYTAEMAAAIVGPHSNVVDGYHDTCARDGWDL